MTSRPRLRPSTILALALVTLVGVAAFTWPFFVTSPGVLEHQTDAPWLFALLVGLLALVVLAEMTAEGLDAKTIAVVGVVAAAGGALRVLSAGTAGLEPMFFLLVLAGRVLGPATGFVTGALAMLTGAFLTGIGPWLPFQMLCAGWVCLGAGLLPVPRDGWGERLALAGYGLVAGLAYGLVMNLWFWPFLSTSSAPVGAGFVPGGTLATNLAHYAVFYVITSLAWDLPRGILTAVLVLVAGRPVLGTLRRAVRKASFDAPVTFSPDPSAASPSAAPATTAATVTTQEEP